MCFCGCFTDVDGPTETGGGAIHQGEREREGVGACNQPNKCLVQELCLRADCGQLHRSVYSCHISDLQHGNCGVDLL